jgi:hypothetical protein
MLQKFRLAWRARPLHGRVLAAHWVNSFANASVQLQSGVRIQEFIDPHVASANTNYDFAIFNFDTDLLGAEAVYAWLQANEHHLKLSFILEIVKELCKRLVYLVTLHCRVNISVALQVLDFALQLTNLRSQVLNLGICFLQLSQQLHRRHICFIDLLFLLQQEGAGILYLLPLC